MSRVHEALRRAGQQAAFDPFALERSAVPLDLSGNPAFPPADLLASVASVPYNVSPNALIFDAMSLHQPPAEEFRTARTRINHMQSLQPIHTIVVTSPSPAEGKSFVAVNLALAEAQLEGNLTLLCDFDLRRPLIHTLFGIDRAPGISDYLRGAIPLDKAMYRIGESNLYVMPAGEPVINPLELLNLKEVRWMMERLPALFNWVILDSPPLLLAADASLLSTFCHGTILVARIGATTVDSVKRAMQSLCQNNVLGIVVNGARQGEMYNKYSYYQSDDSGQGARAQAKTLIRPDTSESSSI